jgi:hypothetical protein
MINHLVIQNDSSFPQNFITDGTGWTSRLGWDDLPL